MSYDQMFFPPGGVNDRGETAFDDPAGQYVDPFGATLSEIAQMRGLPANAPYGYHVEPGGILRPLEPGRDFPRLEPGRNFPRSQPNAQRSVRQPLKETPKEELVRFKCPHCGESQYNRGICSQCLGDMSQEPQPLCPHCRRVIMAGNTYHCYRCRGNLQPNQPKRRCPLCERLQPTDHQLFCEWCTFDLSRSKEDIIRCPRCWEMNMNDWYTCYKCGCDLPAKRGVTFSYEYGRPSYRQKW